MYATITGCDSLRLGGAHRHGTKKHSEENNNRGTALVSGVGDRFRYCPQVPLGVICSHSVGWLPNEIWKFWVNSRVDIALMKRGFKASRNAKLVIECQSHYHDSLEAQVRDRKKAKLLEKVGVPLIYVRSVETDRRFYRFYTPDENTEVFYNIINQEGRTELETFLTAILTL
ncbi:MULTISPECIES: DUF2726 domain-containing protein [Planktothrix]|uniref:DUF2726 domain-containing protein n=1 Tax=Planktothrix TaxID=54304 RepID=UPI0009DC3818|nr:MULTISPECIES: DUF2726 domain-containing protein [Planktothrix]